MIDTNSLKKRARAARRQAELTVARELTDWYRVKKQEIADATDLTDSERGQASFELLMEMGRRSKRDLARAKRQNTLPKQLEREARAEIEAARQATER